MGLWPNHPSCEYPIGSGIEHLFDGGLWVGGFQSDYLTVHNKIGPFVSTGSVDASSISSTRGGGFEFTNAAGKQIIERSSLCSIQDFIILMQSHIKIF